MIRFQGMIESLQFKSCKLTRAKMSQKNLNKQSLISWSNEETTKMNGQCLHIKIRSSIASIIYQMTQVKASALNQKSSTVLTLSLKNTLNKYQRVGTLHSKLGKET